ncbi:trigger factor [Veillonella criceti]|uniref:Trigger factor n=1 Tax=Veillonella criceti TaxID=103891 RepID=A0A380NMS4_9FIRM|nr:trigger factor [Veillonella criceti]SUP44941.1 Trigger factor [Veillonella criceti]
MNATVTPVDQHKVTLTIEVPAKDVTKGIQQAVKRIAGQVNIPGFRKGKAPRRILEMNFGKEAILEEAFETIAGRAYQEALVANEIVPVSEPEIERVTFEEGKDLVFKATLTKRPEVTLGDYKGLEAEKQEAKVTDEQIQEQLDNIRNQQAKMVVADKDAKLQKDDFAVIDFAGSIDGKPFDGGEGKSYPLQIGSGSFIPGFEDQLIGHAAGDDVEVKVTFPEDYFVKELANKEAVFKTHIHDIKRKELPELNDEFAKEASSYETIEELKADLRKQMEEDATRRAIDAYNAELIETAVKNATVEIPEVMVEDRVEQMIQEMAMNLESRGLKLEDYLKFSNKTMDGLKEEYHANAAENVRADLVLEAVAKAENIEVTPEDMNIEIYTMAQQFGADPKEVMNIIVKEGRVAMLRNSVARKKAARLIIEQAKGAESQEK